MAQRASYQHPQTDSAAVDIDLATKEEQQQQQQQPPTYSPTVGSAPSAGQPQPEPLATGVVLQSFARTTRAVMGNPPSAVSTVDGVSHVRYTPMNAALVVCATIGLVFTLADTLSLIFDFNLVALVIAIITSVATAVLAFLARRERLEFDDGAREFRIAQLRLLFVLCSRWEPTFTCPYEDLGEPFAEGAPGANGVVQCVIYLPVARHQGGNLAIHSAGFHSLQDQEYELGRWIGFVNSKRGATPMPAALVPTMHLV